MKIKLTGLVMALAFVVLGAACGGGGNTTTTNSSTTNTASTSENKNAKPPSMKTPEGTFKIAYEAIKVRDYEGFKKTLTSDYLELLQGLADREKKSVNDIIARGLTKHPVPENPETRNIEQQDDGSMKMEFKDGNGQWLLVYMIQDGNDWKFTPGPGSNLIEDIAEGSGKEGTEKDIKGKDAKEKKSK